MAKLGAVGRIGQQVGVKPSVAQVRSQQEAIAQSQQLQIKISSTIAKINSGQITSMAQIPADVISYINIPENYFINKAEAVKQQAAYEKQKAALETIRENVLKPYNSTGVQQVLNTAVFDLLKYIVIFPAGAKLTDSKGNILPDCFLLPPNTTALDFAYSLHTDIGDKFAKALDVRTRQAVGKDHPLKHRDGIEILTR